MYGMAGLFGQIVVATSLGLILKRSIFSEIDTNAVFTFLEWITLPSFILYGANALSMGVDFRIALPAVGIAALGAVLSVFLAWTMSRGVHPKERALVSGLSIGYSCPILGLPIVTLLFGQMGMVCALLCTALDALLSYGFSYALFTTSGPAFPKDFKHTDGGTYNGEWKGMLKEGFGVYNYASGARYEGEWRDGIKDGRGVYHFPKGGVYEGEWKSGKMTGVGVRTFSNGRIQAGMWKDGKLASPLEEWQCALVLESANEAATIARNVVVGGAGLDSITRNLISRPVVWSFVISALVHFMDLKILTPTIVETTTKLAAAHIPLALVAFGLSIDLSAPPKHQRADVAKVIGVRLLPVLLMAFVASLWIYQMPAEMLASALNAFGAVVICFTGILPRTALQNAHIFRLNENLTASIVRINTASVLIMYPLISVGTLVAIQIGKPLIMSLITGFLVVLVAILTFIGQKMGITKQKAREKVKMVYTGPTAMKSTAKDADSVDKNSLVQMQKAGGAQDYKESLNEITGQNNSDSSEKNSEGNTEKEENSTSPSAPTEPEHKSEDSRTNIDKQSETKSRSKFRDVDVDAIRKHRELATYRNSNFIKFSIPKHGIYNRRTNGMQTGALVQTCPRNVHRAIRI